jgi:hypothetical protein
VAKYPANPDDPRLAKSKAQLLLLYVLAAGRVDAMINFTSSVCHCGRARPAATRRVASARVALRKNPITRMASWCARAASGHAAAPPSNLMKSRRLMPGVPFSSYRHNQSLLPLALLSRANLL